MINDKNGRKEHLLNEVLSPWSQYRFRVQASNYLGKGEFSIASPVVS